MLQIKELNESELLVALAAITETAADIAQSLRIIKSEEISSDNYSELVELELSYFKTLYYYYYDKQDLEYTMETQNMVDNYRYMHELY